MLNTSIKTFLCLIAFSSLLSAEELRLLKIPSSQAQLKQALWHYPNTAPSKKTMVLFLHGATFPSKLASGFKMENQSWMSVTAAAGYTVYALDYIGYGASDRYPVMSKTRIDTQAPGNAKTVIEDIKVAIDYITSRENHKNLAIIAHSRGGLIALLLAAKNENLVSKLILLSPVLPRPPDAENPIAIDNHAYEDINVDERVNAFKLGNPSGSNVLANEVETLWANAWLATEPIARLRNNRTVRIPLGYISDIRQAWNNQIKLDNDKITQPILMMRGEWDHVPDQHEAETFIKTLSNSKNKKLITIPKSTHVALLENNRRMIYQYTLEFLKLH